jgi:AcrR family transcriptional regulator
VTKKRGPYSSPAQIERRDRILRQTLNILELEGVAGVSMSRIAEMSSVSTKTLYNIFSNLNALLVAAASVQLDEIQVSDELMNSAPGIPRIFALTRGAMSLFQESPDYMETVISVIVQISAQEEAEFNRLGRTQRWCFDNLQAAGQQGELLAGTDCLQLSQLLAASQWGVTLMWQKGLISTGQLPVQASLKHCIDLMPFCTPERRAWLEEQMHELTGGSSAENPAFAPLTIVQRG